MENFIKPELLSDNASSFEEGYYQLPLSKDELDLEKNRLVNLSVKINNLKSEEKNRRKEFKAEIKPKEDELSGILECCETGQKECHGRMYSVVDYNTNKIGVYAQEGYLISERLMRQEDNQLTIKHSATGTDGYSLTLLKNQNEKPS